MGGGGGAPLGVRGNPLFPAPQERDGCQTSRAEALEARRGDTGAGGGALARRRFGSTFVAGQRWKNKNESLLKNLYRIIVLLIPRKFIPLCLQIQIRERMLDPGILPHDVFHMSFHIIIAPFIFTGEQISEQHPAFFSIGKILCKRIYVLIPLHHPLWRSSFLHAMLNKFAEQGMLLIDIITRQSCFYSFLTELTIGFNIRVKLSFRHDVIVSL